METLDLEIFSFLAPFFVNLPPYAERGKTSEHRNFFPFATAGIEPEPPAQQASVLSIATDIKMASSMRLHHLYVELLVNNHGALHISSLKNIFIKQTRHIY